MQVARKKIKQQQDTGVATFIDIAKHWVLNLTEYGRKSSFHRKTDIKRNIGENF
jgi:hypothetical protein